MISKKTFEDRIYCAINQAKVRNIEIVSNDWHLAIGRNGICIPDNSGKLFLLSFFVENKSYHNYKGDIFYQIAAKTLDTSYEVVSKFGDGFVRGRTTNLSSDLDSYAFDLGVKLYKKLIKRNDHERIF